VIFSQNDGGKLKHLEVNAMVSEFVTVTDETGLHARPANAFVKIALAQPCNITFKKDGRTYNGKSIVNVLTAGVRCGDEIELVADGDNERQSLDKIVAAVKSGLSK
jgi:phosphocarrier protein